jgi:putative transposase
MGVGVMRGPKPPVVELSPEVRHALEALLRRRSLPQQLALRARIVLAAAEGQHNSQIARSLDLEVDTVRRWRNRWLSFAPIPLAEFSLDERLSDVPRSGRPIQITAEQRCQIVALACEAPPEAGRPISQWTGREIADEVVKRGILPKISPRHAARLLKKGISNRTSAAIG